MSAAAASMAGVGLALVLEVARYRPGGGSLARVVVGDVCLYPQIMRANTNLPAVMTGERIAQLLLDA